MNGILMMHGIDATSVLVGSAQELNEKMVRFYVTRAVTEMMAFLASYRPEATSRPGLAS